MTAPELVAQVRDLPAVSPAALRLIQLLGQDTVGNAEVIQTLKCDAVLTAKLLRLCNASSIALAEPVASVDQAVILLGHQEILRLVLALTCGKALAAPVPGYALEANELWSHSLVTAVAAEIVAGDGIVAEASLSVAFTVGLLHDIGKLVMGQALTPELQATLRHEVTAHGHSRAEAERLVLGADHAEVGACLLRAWRLPENLVEAVASHHQPGRAAQPGLTEVVFLANCLAHLAGSAPGWEAFAVRVPPDFFARAKLTPDKLCGFLISIREARERLNPYLHNA